MLHYINLVSNQNFQNFGLNGKCPWFPYAAHLSVTKPLVLPRAMVPKFGTLRAIPPVGGGGGEEGGGEGSPLLKWSQGLNSYVLLNRVWFSGSRGYTISLFSNLSYFTA